MNLRQTRLHILQDAENLTSKAKTGVSLHCHTEHSREMLDFIPHYAAKLPVIAYFWKKERAKYQEKEGKDIDFSMAFWSPPLTAPMVYGTEKQQINNVGLAAIVSITDHDCIDSTLEVNKVEKTLTRRSRSNGRYRLITAFSMLVCIICQRTAPSN